MNEISSRVKAIIHNRIDARDSILQLSREIAEWAHNKPMKYYITADVHGFYTEFHMALDEAGYFYDLEPHKLIILGDIFDRG